MPGETELSQVAHPHDGRRSSEDEWRGRLPLAARGLSIAVAFKGTAPDTATSTLVPGTGGPMGSGGELGTPAPDGFDGLSAPSYEIP